MAGGRAPILIVDDDEDTRYVLAHILEAEGHATAGARTGSEALDYLRANPVCLVILDLTLPDMSGAAVRAAMGRDATLAAIPVVVYSGFDERGSIPDVVAWVRKGGDVGDLLAAVAKACGAP
jgi:CheY-like chemotaxis protein